MIILFVEIEEYGVNPCKAVVLHCGCLMSVRKGHTFDTVVIENYVGKKIIIKIGKLTMFAGMNTQQPQSNENA